VSKERDKERAEDLERSVRRREDALDVFMVLVDGEFTPAGGLVSAIMKFPRSEGFSLT
jgi:hypothetical protein